VGVAKDGQLHMVLGFQACRVFDWDGQAAWAAYSVAFSPSDGNCTGDVTGEEVTTFMVSGSLSVVGGRSQVNDGSVIMVTSTSSAPQPRSTVLTAGPDASFHGFLAVQGEDGRPMVLDLGSLLLPEDGNLWGGWVVSPDTALGVTDVAAFLQSHAVSEENAAAAGLDSGRVCAIFQIAPDGTLLRIP